ncbi:LysM domain-containing protein, partial [Yersinia intermedia]|uniref:LysM peptidoglycan-binding domain-containing protein n=1 Tax=Yersinia intermedia TaxID=631 RepID=UPI0022FDC84E
MKKPIRLSIIASLLLGGSGVTVSLLPIMGHAEAPTTRIYTVESRTSLYQIALQSGLNLRELRQLNKGSLDSRDTLNAGESLLLPINSPLFPVDPLAGKVIASDLPELGMGNDPVPLNGAGAGAQKTASVAQAVGAQDWNNMTSDQMKNQAESWAKNKAKAQVVDPLRQQA